MSDNHDLILKNLNLKITPKRLAVLNILADELVFVSPEEIWRKMKSRFKNIGLPTVYRILEELCEGGVISKIIHPTRQLYYYYCKNLNHHHHFICMSCRRVEDVNLCAAKEIEKQVAGNLKGKVLSHIIQVNGFCKTCSQKKAPDES
ncbi:MAG: transcriptional repressor [Thermodesulfovibrio sp.]|nr:transcriptional repressor [Thermodesulfovibrio sp.]